MASSITQAISHDRARINTVTKSQIVQYVSHVDKDCDYPMKRMKRMKRFTFAVPKRRAIIGSLVYVTKKLTKLQRMHFSSLVVRMFVWILSSLVFWILLGLSPRIRRVQRDYHGGHVLRLGVNEIVVRTFRGREVSVRSREYLSTSGTHLRLRANSGMAR